MFGRAFIKGKPDTSALGLSRHTVVIVVTEGEKNQRRNIDIQAGIDALTLMKMGNVKE